MAACPRVKGLLGHHGPCPGDASFCRCLVPGRKLTSSTCLVVQVTPSLLATDAWGIKVVYYSSYSSFWGAIVRHPGPGYAALRALCAPALAKSPAQPGGEEFAMMGCIARAVLKPGSGVLEGPGGTMVRDAMGGGAILGMHVRLGSMHTSNYQVGACSAPSPSPPSLSMCTLSIQLLVALLTPTRHCIAAPADHARR